MVLLCSCHLKKRSILVKREKAWGISIKSFKWKRFNIVWIFHLPILSSESKREEINYSHIHSSVVSHCLWWLLPKKKGERSCKKLGDKKEARICVRERGWWNKKAWILLNAEYETVVYKRTRNMGDEGWHVTLQMNPEKWILDILWWDIFVFNSGFSLLSPISKVTTTKI